MRRLHSDIPISVDPAFTAPLPSEPQAPEPRDLVVPGEAEHVTKIVDHVMDNLVAANQNQETIEEN